VLKNLSFMIFLVCFLSGCKPSQTTVLNAKITQISGFDLSLPTGIAADQQGNLFIVDSGNHRVVRLTSSGKMLLSWGIQGTQAGEFNFYKDNGTLCGIAVDALGQVYVVDKGNDRIQKFSSFGDFSLMWGGAGSEPGQFMRAIYIAAAPDGSLYVTDDSNPLVQQFDANGELLQTWGSYGKGDGQFRHATGIVVDSSGNVYISDYQNRTIQKFNGRGEFIKSWKTGQPGKYGIPEALAVDNEGRIYVTDSRLIQIEVFDQEGNSLGVIPLPKDGVSNPVLPYGIAISGENEIFVTDRDNNRLLKINLFAW